MSEDKQKLYYDNRVVNRYINSKKIEKADFDSYIKSLPDSEPDATWVTMDLHDTELGEELVEDSSDN